MGKFFYLLMLAYKDYYPFGMPMPSRNMEGAYRYAYQGQEKDQETGMEAFEARLWDSRIGRWLTIDPAHEFFSPYMGMGNNPISTIDPDGRCTKCPDNASVGDTFVDPSTGDAFLYSENGWATGDGLAGALDDVVIGGNKMTPVDVGMEWLTGTGPRHRDFVAGDTFTDMLISHDHVKDALNIISERIVSNEEHKPISYSLAGIQGVGKYVKDYSTLLTAGQTGNLAVTYLGSYSLNYTVTDIDIKRRTAIVHFTVGNSSSIQSATRPPVIGYTDVWKNGPGRWINNVIQTGPMSRTTQTFTWSKGVKF